MLAFDFSKPCFLLGPGLEERSCVTHLLLHASRHDGSGDDECLSESHVLIRQSAAFFNLCAPDTP